MYDIIVEEGGPVRRDDPQNPLDQIVDDRDRQLADDIKRARAETILAEERRKQQTLRGIHVDDGTGSGTVELPFPGFRQQPQAPSSPAGSIVASLIQGGLSPEKAQEFIRGLAPEDIAKLNMFASGPRPGGADPMMTMMLLGKFGSQPQVTVKDMLEIGPRFVESAQKMAELNRPQSGGNEYVSLLKTMIEEAGKDRKDALEVLKGQVQGDPIKTTSDVVKALRDSGFISQSQGSDKPEMLLKIEEMRGEREMDMMKMRIEQNRYLQDKQSESERWNSILSTAPAALALFAKPLEEAVRAAARKMPQPASPPGQAPAQAQTVQTVTLECNSCKSRITVQEPFPQTVSCPNCGHTAPMPAT